MAVAPTGAIYKALEFDGVSSRTYGVYITGEAVYNAPERDVKMITIPGRSGSFALDNGRFENITVTYPAGIFAETEADFREAISEFRNFLCSRKGYVRLQDEYNPDEYRMAVYKSGLEVEPAMLKAGEFEITFDCKPQRWLVSGETAITIGEWRGTETVTGDIVEVENPDEILGVKSLSVSLSPIQDLHGYDKPWMGSEEYTNPYLMQAMPQMAEYYNTEYLKKIVGGTVVWNQLVKNTGTNTAYGLTATIDTNGKLTISGQLSSYGDFRIYGGGVEIPEGHKLLFGGASAHFGARLQGSSTYVSSAQKNRVLQAGTGWISDIVVHSDSGSATLGETYNESFYPQCFDLTAMFGSTIADYIYNLEQTTAGAGVAFFRKLFPKDYYPYNSGELISVNTSAHVTKDGNGQQIASYPLDSSLTLRGIPKLNNGQLYYDGDTYESDGTVTRKYGIRAYQSGDESLTDAITDGTNTVYKLATPTTENATPYTSQQSVDPSGTESFTASNIVPVGQVSSFARICPISGRTEVETVVSPTTSAEDGTTYTTDLGRTVYGGTLDVVSGVLVVDRGYIASYNGETLPSTWISDRDEYASGTTPTIGAEVVYELATPQTYQLTPQQVELLTGENNVWSDSGDITLEYGQLPNLLINPTLFESGPLLEVEGYGTINMNGHTIEIDNAVLGVVEIAAASGQTFPGLVTEQLPYSVTKALDYSNYSGVIENEDSLFIDAIQITTGAFFEFLSVKGATPTPTITADIGNATASGTVRNVEAQSPGGKIYIPEFTIIASISNIELTAFTNESYAATITAPLKDTTNQTLRTLVINVSIENHESGILEVVFSFTGSAGTFTQEPFYCNNVERNEGGNIEFAKSYIYSTQSILGNPLYLDCDLGEAYKIEAGQVISLNQHIDLGSKLPTLSPGANVITYDNTIIDLKIAPRWWKV